MDLRSILTKNLTTKVAYVPFFWRKVEFSLFLVGELLSIPCYLFVLYHTIINKTARQSLHNHVIIVLLFYNFLQLTLDLSMTMGYSRLGYVSPFSPALCLIWQFVDFGIWYGGVFLMFWTSVERHILIFHSSFVRTIRQRIFIHYIPLAFFSLYAPILYFYLIFLYPCNHVFVNTAVRCGSMCYEKSVANWFYLYDSLVNYIGPLLLIAIFSIALILRFLRQKRRLQQAATWRQCRKMIIQLILVSAVYLIFDLPLVIIVIVQWSGYPNFGSHVISPYISRLTYIPAIILPYANLFSIPQLDEKFRALLFWKRNRRVIAPTTHGQ